MHLIDLPATFEATVLMDPVPKARAKTVIEHGLVRTYTPEKTADAEAFIRACVWQQQSPQYLVWFRAGTPLAMELIFTLRKPPFATRKYPTPRPDVDNLAKTVLDALKGIVYVDDAQVVELNASKCYVGDLSPSPKVVIRVRELR